MVQKLRAVCQISGIALSGLQRLLRHIISCLILISAADNLLCSVPNVSVAVLLVLDRFALPWLMFWASRTACCADAVSAPSALLANDAVCAGVSCCSCTGESVLDSSLCCLLGDRCFEVVHGLVGKG